LVLRLAKVLVEKGLMDEAAREFHDASLGRVLADLATADKARR
jgi:hypothetical protein